MDFTGFAAVLAVILTLICCGFAVPGVRVARAARDAAPPRRRAGLVAGAALLLAASVPPGYGAARLVWAAHRGDYAPYASQRRAARPVCVANAKSRGLRGADRSADVKRCIQAAIED